MLSPENRIKIKDNIVYRVIDGEAVLLNMSSGQYYGLDGVGTRMWELLLSKGSVEPAVQTLLAEYDVEEGQLRADLQELLARLVDKGLLEIHAA